MSGLSKIELVFATSVVAFVVLGAYIQPSLGVQAGLTGIGILMNMRGKAAAAQPAAKAKKKRGKARATSQAAPIHESQSAAAPSSNVIAFVLPAERLGRAAGARREVVAKDLRA